MIMAASLSTGSSIVFKLLLALSGMGGMMNILFVPSFMMLEIFSHPIIILILLQRFLNPLFQKLTIGWSNIMEFFKATTFGII